MRWLRLALLTSTACVLAYAVYPRSTCERTLAYSVGELDPRFGVSAEQVRAAAEQAASLWGEATGRPVFRYDPAAPFAINLRYDERQPHALAVKQEQQRIQTDDAALMEVRGRFEALKAAYEAGGRAYEREMLAWKIAGSPPDQWARLDARRRELNAQAEQLNFMISQLRPAAQSLNSEVASLNSQAGKPFDRGVFTGDRIDVFQFDDPKDLSLILAHEFGHALSVEHVQDPRAVMYYLRNDQNFKELALTDADKKGLDLACAQLSTLDPRMVARWRETFSRWLNK